MSFLLIIIVSLHIFNLSEAQRLEPGPCPKHITVKSDFDFEKYMGVWYQYAEYPFIFDPTNRCIKVVYKMVDNETISVDGEQIDARTGVLEGNNGIAKIVGSGKLDLVFMNTERPFEPAKYWILDTDYDNYAVVYSCTTILTTTNAKALAIITRKRQPSNETIAETERVIRSQQLSWFGLRLSNQTDCD